MSTLGETGRDAVRLVGEVAKHEARVLRREVRRPWIEGDQTPTASFGRWLGLGLALGAILGGIAMAFYAERPWE
jgi:hypothetical protein